MSFDRKPKKVIPEEVDPNVYLYDEIYDEIKDQAAEEYVDNQGEKSAAKSSKYIDGLKETAERRKVDKEIRRFKRYARDREEAVEEPPENIFITSAYRKKLEEVKIVEESRRRAIKDEEKKTMNFLKRSHSKTKDDHEREDIEKVDATCLKTSRIELEENPDRTLKEGKSKGASEKEAASSSNRNVGRPKCHKDRKRILRRILSKRTVGKVYEEALMRYRERKKLALSDPT